MNSTSVIIIIIKINIKAPVTYQCDVGIIAYFTINNNQVVFWDHNEIVQWLVKKL